MLFLGIIRRGNLPIWLVQVPDVLHVAHLEVHLIAVLVVGFVPHSHELVSNPEARQEKKSIVGGVLSETHHKPRPQNSNYDVTAGARLFSHRTLASELRSIVV